MAVCGIYNVALDLMLCTPCQSKNVIYRMYSPKLPAFFNFSHSQDVLCRGRRGISEVLEEEDEEEAKTNHQTRWDRRSFPRTEPMQQENKRIMRGQMNMRR
jgi:hypothetical protein